MGIWSPLTTQIVDFGTKNSNPRNSKVTKLTIHHMAGKTTNPAGIAELHRVSNVSTNYYISEDKIVGGVSEDRRTWASNSPSNDHAAITFEVANNSYGPNWTVSDKTYNTLVKLCAEICNRYGIVPHYDGTKNGTITMHKQFVATACPGPYLENLIVSHKFENDILAAMTGGAHAVHNTAGFPNTPFVVKVKISDLNIRKGAGTNTQRLGFIKKGSYTIVELKGEWGRLKSGVGWIYLGNRDWVEVR